ncbi:MAG: MerR family transcriptional regulator [Pseudomonadota bacterium]
MRISEAAAACGLSPDTIRYYEKSKMLPKVHRTTNGNRDFSQENVEWLTLLYWLRESGMPLKEMRRFTHLAQAGPETIPERRKILLDHSEQLRRRREKLDRCEAVLAVKIASYGAPDQENQT